MPATVSADPGQVSTRSITMSSSAPSATNVTYTVQFTPATSTTAGPGADIIVDFCSNDPLVGDSCTATVGTDVPNFSSATVSTAGWTISTIGSGRGVKLLNTSTNLAAGTPVTLTIKDVTNPSNVATTLNNALGIFYGRILTYNKGTAGTDSVTPGPYVDYGGIAMSTSANINITSKVFETLSYCVFQGACGTAPQLALGDTTTGALSDTQAYVSSDAQYKIATNAAGGATVVMRGNTLCRSGTASNCNTATAGSFTITSIGATEAQSATGGEQFGMCVDTTGATGALTALAPYDDGSGGTPIKCHTGLTSGAYSGSSYFGFDDNTTTGTNSTSGSTIMQSTGPIQSYTGTFSFLGNISTTTEAGIYTTSLNTVATGTF